MNSQPCTPIRPLSGAYNAVREPRPTHPPGKSDRPVDRSFGQGAALSPSDPSKITPFNTSHLGNVVACRPQQLGYSQLGDTLLHSLVIDLTAVVMELVPAYGPPPNWSAEAFGHRYLFVARSGAPVFAPLAALEKELLAV
jgi:hypothetical protein